jgi:pimeloyl-ACP methyl ester carboxylesterase
MYEHKISMATLGGHGIGGKVALAASCYHFDKVTGYFGINTSPMDQYYHESYAELRKYINFLEGLNTKRGYNAINADLKDSILCPKWRSLFQNSLVKAAEGGYSWNFNFGAVHHNLTKTYPSNLTGWSSTIGLYPGRALFALSEHSRFVHLATNTLPMYKVCPRLQGLNEDIFSIQGDDNPLSTHAFTQIIGSTSRREMPIPLPQELPSS